MTAHHHRDARPHGRLLTGAVLLAAAAIVAVVGSVTALVVRRAPGADPPTTSSTTGWTVWSDPPVPADPSGEAMPPLVGIPLVAAAVLGLVAAALLLVGTRRPGDPVRARLLGIGACALLVGAVGAIWIQLAAQRSLAAALSSTGVEQTVAPGVGLWLELLAALAALVALGLLLVPVRAPAAPQWPAAPPGWGPPGPGW